MCAYDTAGGVATACLAAAIGTEARFALVVGKQVKATLAQFARSRVCTRNTARQRRGAQRTTCTATGSQEIPILTVETDTARLAYLTAGK